MQYRFPVFSGERDVLCIDNPICEGYLKCLGGAYQYPRGIRGTIYPIIHETPSEIADSETMMQRAVVPDAEMACAVETRSQTVQYEKGEPYAFP